jgi:hypothetical protein
MYFLGLRAGAKGFFLVLEFRASGFFALPVSFHAHKRTTLQHPFLSSLACSLPSFPTSVPLLSVSLPLSRLSVFVLYLFPSVSVPLPLVCLFSLSPPLCLFSLALPLCLFPSVSFLRLSFSGHMGLPLQIICSGRPVLGLPLKCQFRQ